jgi:hypothetical protein
VDRRTLPIRRSSYRFPVRHGETECLVTVGLYDDGRPGEVFAHVQGKFGKGSDFEAMTRDAAILISLAMQHGVPLDVMRHAITRDDKGAASTLIGAVLDNLEKES